jgi:hypothetical protein
MDRASLPKFDVSMTRRGISGDGHVGINLLSTLSLALDNIDRYNNEYYSRDAHDDDRDGGGDESDVEINGGAARISSSSGINGGPHGINVHNDTANPPGMSPHRRHRPKKPTSPPPSRFSSYLNFNRIAIRSLLAFVLCYTLVLICTYPMVYYSSVDVLPTDDDYANGGRHHIRRGSSFVHVRGRGQFAKARHALGRLGESAVRWEGMAKVEAERRAKMLRDAENDAIDAIVIGTMGRRDGEDAMKASMLMERAARDFEDERRSAIEAEFGGGGRRGNVARGGDNGGGGDGGGHDHWRDALEAWESAMRDPLPVDRIDPVESRDANEGIGGGKKKTPGFIVLGMHRSGTSMLSGLLVKGFGYETGGPLIGASVSRVSGSSRSMSCILVDPI